MRYVYYLEPTFRETASRLLNAKLPIRLAQQALKISKQLREEGADFDVLRKKLLDQYAEKDEAGNMIETDHVNGVANGVKLVKETAPQFHAEFQELLNMEFKISNPFPIEVLYDFPSLELSGEELGFLIDFGFVVDTEAEAEAAASAPQPVVPEAEAEPAVVPDVVSEEKAHE